MYEVCPHIRLSDVNRDRLAKSIAGLSNKKLHHLLSCLPLDPIPEEGGYTLGSMRIAIRTVLDERYKARRRQSRSLERIMERWLPLAVLATVLLVALRRSK